MIERNKTYVSDIYVINDNKFYFYSINSYDIPLYTYIFTNSKSCYEKTNNENASA